MGTDPGRFTSSSNEAVKQELRVGEWRFFEHYEVKEGPHGTYVEAPPSYQVPAADFGEGYNRVKSQWDYLLVGQKGFRPLVDTPALFLEFAGLIEESEITQDVWLDWIRRYGVLGFEGNGEIADRWWAEPRGGPKETLTAFRDAAWQANAVLRIYEAATAPDGPDTAILTKFVSQPRPESPTPGMEGWTEFEEQETPPTLKEWGLRVAWKVVGNVLAGHCYPELYRLKDAFSAAWGFKSSLGAMYLQMMWLMTATGEVRRCEGPGCPRVITYEQPEQVGSRSKNDRSAGYKTRKDKRFCSNRCKNNWRYHHVIKPRKRARF